jgi:hypothetical protein
MAMTSAPIGTIQTIFNNTFILTDPGYVNGLPMWRQIIDTPESGDVTGLGAILPIATAPPVEFGVVKVYFDIKSLDQYGSTKNPENLAFNLLQQPLSSLPSFAPGGSTVRTIPPIQHVYSQGRSKAVLYFNMKSLEKEIIGSEGSMRSSYGKKKKSRVTLKDYNGSNGVNIDSELPMVDQVVGNTATFSFNITQLPKV